MAIETESGVPVRHSGPTLMVGPCVQTRADGPKEPKGIVYLEGPLDGKRLADTGQQRHETDDGHVYHRRIIDKVCPCGTKGPGCTIHFMVYAGPKWLQGVTG